MPLLIDGFEQRFLLDVPQMDATHREFVNLINRMGMADKNEFARLFKELNEHTRTHFDAEQQMMEDSKFPAIGEHRDEHQRVLGELARFGQRLTPGTSMMSRAYVCEQLPQWFALHAQTMDSALAAHLKQVTGRCN